MKIADPCFIGLVAMVFGFVMMIIGAIDYLTNGNQVPSVVSLIGILLVVLGVFLSRKKCEVKQA